MATLTIMYVRSRMLGAMSVLFERAGKMRMWFEFLSDRKPSFSVKFIYHRSYLFGENKYK